MSIISIVRNDESCYPSVDTLFRPSIRYPEYPFSEYSEQENNYVYDMIRSGFAQMGLDINRIETKEWNPLGGLIEPGSNVLLKPNMVMHENANGRGTDCLFTHPSVVAAVIDYVIIAQKGAGGIVIGDAPLQTCDFQELCKKSGYNKLIDYYKKDPLTM